MKHLVAQLTDRREHNSRSCLVKYQLFSLALPRRRKLLVAKRPIRTMYATISTNLPLNPSLIPLYKIQRIKITLPATARIVKYFLNSFIMQSIYMVDYFIRLSDIPFIHAKSWIPKILISSQRSTNTLMAGAVDSWHSHFWLTILSIHCCPQCLNTPLKITPNQ